MLRWIIDLNRQPKTIKLPKENRAENVHDLAEDSFIKQVMKSTNHFFLKKDLYVRPHQNFLQKSKDIVTKIGRPV